MKELITQHWEYIVGYLAMGWLMGAVLFRAVFVTKGCSMGGNSGGQPLFYYRVDMPTMPQAIMYVIGMLLWPFTLVAIGWPLLLFLGVCGGKNIDHEEK